MRSDGRKGFSSFDGEEGGTTKVWIVVVARAKPRWLPTNIHSLSSFA